MDVVRVKELRDNGMGASAIAKEMGIGRYRSFSKWRAFVLRLAGCQYSRKTSDQMTKLLISIILSAALFSNLALAQHKEAKVNPHRASGGNASDFPNEFLAGGRGSNKLQGSVMNSVYLGWPMRVSDTVTH